MSISIERTKWEHLWLPVWDGKIGTVESTHEYGPKDLPPGTGYMSAMRALGSSGWQMCASEERGLFFKREQR